MVVEGRVHLSLRQAARTHRLSILEAPSAHVACRAILSLHPRVVVVQVSRSAGQALEFIRLATNSAPSLPLIAVATAHADEIESAARNAGAAWYLADTASPVIDEVLAAVIAQEN